MQVNHTYGNKMYYVGKVCLSITKKKHNKLKNPIPRDLPLVRA